jgi:hypothetical protein
MFWRISPWGHLAHDGELELDTKRCVPCGPANISSNIRSAFFVGIPTPEVSTLSTTASASMLGAIRMYQDRCKFQNVEGI